MSLNMSNLDIRSRLSTDRFTKKCLHVVIHAANRATHASTATRHGIVRRDNRTRSRRDRDMLHDWWSVMTSIPITVFVVGYGRFALSYLAGGCVCIFVLFLLQALIA
jgi:hypothetical protein